MKESEQTVIQQLESSIPELMEKYKIEGSSFALISNNQISWVKGFGYASKAEEVRVDTTTIFEAGSITKPFVAYGALELFEQSSLDLSLPLTKYFEENYVPDEPLLNQISAWNILTHTSGFPNWRSEEKPMRCAFNPGTRFSYSGEGFVYLQRVMEHLTGEPLAEYLRKIILKPLKMKLSSFVWEDRFHDLKAVSYYPDGKERNKVRHTKEANAAGSLLTNPSELAQFLIAMMNTNENSLEKHIFDKMLEPQVPINNLALGNDHWPNWPEDKTIVSDKIFWGLGWGLEKSEKGEAFWHWGNNQTYQAFCMGIREKKEGIVMMANNENASKMWKPILEEVYEGKHPSIEWIHEGTII